MTHWRPIQAGSKSTSDSLEWRPHNRHIPPPAVAEQGDLEEDDFLTMKMETKRMAVI